MHRESLLLPMSRFAVQVISLGTGQRPFFFFPRTGFSAATTRAFRTSKLPGQSRSMGKWGRHDMAQPGLSLLSGQSSQDNPHATWGKFHSRQPGGLQLQGSEEWATKPLVSISFHVLKLSHISTLQPRKSHVSASGAVKVGF